MATQQTDQKNMSEWLVYVEKNPGAKWNVRKSWSRYDGWRVEWIVGDRSLNMSPDVSKKACRDTREMIRQRFANMPLGARNGYDPDALRGLFDKWAADGAECELLNRDNAMPAGAGGAYAGPVNVLVEGPRYIRCQLPRGSEAWRPIPFPGSDEAAEQGCTCPVEQDWPGFLTFSDDCKVHELDSPKPN